MVAIDATIEIVDFFCFLHATRHILLYFLWSKFILHYYIWLKIIMKVCHEKVKNIVFMEKEFKFLEKFENAPDVRRYSDILELSPLFWRTFIAIAKKVQECHYRDERSSTYVY